MKILAIVFFAGDISLLVLLFTRGALGFTTLGFTFILGPDRLLTAGLCLQTFCTPREFSSFARQGL